MAESAQIAFDPQPPPEWKQSHAPEPYLQAVHAMEARVKAIAEGRLPEQVWLLEHPALYTAGTSAKRQDLLAPDRLPVFHTGRGGQFTFHGPGQRIAYVMLDLKSRGCDIRSYVAALENWLIDVLDRLGVKGETRPGRVGIWVTRRGINGARREDKIAAIGVRVRRWVSYHGVSLNVAPDLSHYQGIVPCGIDQHGVTSLADLGVDCSMRQVDEIYRDCFARHFEPDQTVGRT